MISLTTRKYHQAKEFIAEQGYGSSKTLQSKFNIGHHSAIFILEMMEKAQFLEKPNCYGVWKIRNEANW